LPGINDRRVYFINVESAVTVQSNLTSQIDFGSFLQSIKRRIFFNSFSPDKLYLENGSADRSNRVKIEGHIFFGIL
ncbi:hypothetical protein QT971_22315, partial [Microcoleus sp. herbarium19]|uniref:hypothetical protein n=1 Tax=unclassified Microcoleus TaxID=2642155 RepID=UPI002FD6FF68